jgi:hypothetical protein
MAFQDLRGRDGTVVISKTRNGLVTRPWVFPINPNSGPQEAARAALSKAARTFKGFSPTLAATWDAYGDTQVRRDPVTGVDYTLSGINAFVELGAKFLQVSPNGALPQNPPTSPFLGDAPLVTATAGTGKVTFTANVPNGSGIRTELLLQPLPGGNRKPNPRGYRTKAFVSFVPGTLSFDVAVTPGRYAAAYRFVLVATGQATEIVPLPVVSVTLAVSEGGRSRQGKKAA